jgi:2-succinyl-5-enolpyruvyl-6-hydroxy-3-cyclohexene-1-carboxylate synthase
MTSTRDTYLLLRALADELARCGIAGACTSPGSRSAPLVLSLVRDGRFPCFSHVDERSSAFFALGLAKATGRPAVLACTSGTAAANYLPAVIEAREARVPLVVLTADRPPELRDTGAGQTVDQVKLYGDAVKWFVEVGVHEATAERLRWIRALACRAVWTALDGRPGPVHLNLPLREPLVLAEPLEADERGPAAGGGRPDGRPWVVRPSAPPDRRAGAQVLARIAGSARRGVVVAGREERGRREPAERSPLARTAAAFAEAAGWPLLADPLSGARTGAAAVAHYDALLRVEAFAEAARPDVVVRIGDLPTSKPLRAWLAGLDAVQVLLDPDGAWQDPAQVADLVLPHEPAGVLAALAEEAPHGEEAWAQAWADADSRAARAIERTLGEELSEPRLAAELGARLPADATLVVASSMPVRDVETFFGVRDVPPRVLSNRGANGIDGTLAAAYGVAAASDGPVVALAGDVAVAHDIGSLLIARRLAVPLTIVLVDNGGGGIFDFLPVSTQRDAYEHHVATPTGLDFAHAAALFGLHHLPVDDLAGLRAAVDHGLASAGTTLVHVRTDRAANVALHRRVWEAVARELATEVTPPAPAAAPGA